MASSMWAQAAGHVRAARLLMRTGHHGRGHAEKHALKELSREVIALEKVLDHFRSLFNLDELAEAAEYVYSEDSEDSEEPSDDEGKGVSGAETPQVDAPHITTGAPPRNNGPGPAPLMSLLLHLTHTTPELVAAICKHLSKEARCALRASCCAGRDAVRAATTTMSMQFRPEEGRHVTPYLPKQDLNITHPHLQHLTLYLNSRQPYLPTDLAAATPTVFQQLKTLTLCWDTEHVATARPLRAGKWQPAHQIIAPTSAALLHELRQLVALCTELSKLVVVDGSVQLVFEAPHNQFLDDLEKLFLQHSHRCYDPLIATGAAQKYLTQAGHKDGVVENFRSGLPVSSIDGLLRCSQLRHLNISTPLTELPRDLLALSQLMHLAIAVASSPKIMASLHVLQALPKLQYLAVVLKDMEPVGTSDAGPHPTSLHLPALQRLALKTTFWRSEDPCLLYLVAAITAPQLTRFTMGGGLVPIPSMLQFASRHPALKLPGAIDGTADLAGTGRQLVEAAHQVPDLLNHALYINEATALEVATAVQIAGTHLHSLVMHPHSRMVQMDDLILDDSLLHAIAASCPNIKNINLRHRRSSFTSQGVSALASSLPGLEVLVLECDAVEDSCIRSLGLGCPLLRRVDLPGCERVSEDAVVDLCTAAPKLSRGTIVLRGFNISQDVWQRIESSRAAA